MEVKILLIPNGRWQQDLLYKLLELGLKVYAVHPNDSYDDFNKIQEFLKTDVRNIDDIESFCRKNGVNYLITDQSDIALKTLSKLGEKLGLNTLPSALAEIFTDKHFMRKTLYNKFSLNIPKFYEVSNYNNLIRLIKKDKKYILKPRIGQGSLGLFIIDKGQKKFLRNLKSHDFLMEKMLLEEYVEGIEITVEGYKFFDKHISLCTSVKTKYSYLDTVAKSLRYGGEVNFSIDKLHSLNDSIVEFLGLDYGITHAEYKYYEGEFYLIEIAARGGGNRISSKIVPIHTNVDVQDILISDTLGGANHSSICEPKIENVVELYFFELKVGKIFKRINNIESIKKHPNVVDIEINLQPGQEVFRVTSDNDRHGYFIIYAETRTNLEIIKRDLLSSMEVLYE